MMESSLLQDSRDSDQKLELVPDLSPCSLQRHRHVVCGDHSAPHAHVSCNRRDYHNTTSIEHEFHERSYIDLSSP